MPSGAIVARPAPPREAAAGARAGDGPGPGLKDAAPRAEDHGMTPPRRQEPLPRAAGVGLLTAAAALVAVQQGAGAPLATTALAGLLAVFAATALLALRAAAPGHRVSRALLALAGAGLVAGLLVASWEPARPDGGLSWLWARPLSLVVAAGLVLAAVHRLSGGSVRLVAALFDAGALVLVAALPRWPDLSAGRAEGQVWLDRATSLLGVLAALLVLVVVARALPGGASSRALRVPLLAALGALVVDAAMQAAGGRAPTGSWPELLPLGAATVLLGLLLAAPGGGAPAATARRAEERMPGLAGRIALLSALGGAAPASLLVGEQPVTTRDVVQVVLCCLLLALSSLAHLAWRSHLLATALDARTEALQQGQQLLDAGQALLGAAGTAQVRRAAVDGAVRLAGHRSSRTDGRWRRQRSRSAASGRVAAALALGSPDLLELVAATASGTDLAPAFEVGALTTAERRRLAAGEAVVRPLGPAPGWPGAAPEALLVLPLRTRERWLGVLMVVATATALEDARALLEVHALHAALALGATRAARAVVGSVPCAPGQQLAAPDADVPAGLVQEISRAMGEGEFTCHYQPIMDITAGRVAGFEALVRWQHPERGLLTPASFLATVHDAGMLTALDGVLLREACRAAVHLDPRASGPYVSVNLSIGQLLDASFPLQVRGALTESGLAPWRLQLEVTEVASLEQPDLAAATLARLRAMRVRIAFDDFGTGHSSVAWLQQLPLDVVKIDKSFVDRLPTGEGERPVVAAVTAMSQTLGLGVVAEGVETVEQQQALLAVGVRHAQGWLYARALPLDLARAFLADHQGPAATDPAVGPATAAAVTARRPQPQPAG